MKKVPARMIPAEMMVPPVLLAAHFPKAAVGADQLLLPLHQPGLGPPRRARPGAGATGGGPGLFICRRAAWPAGRRLAQGQPRV